MSRTLRFTAPALIALLAACGEGPVDLNMADGSADVRMADGTAISTDATGEGLALPDNLPAFAPIYPGGTVQQVVVNDRSPNNGVVSYKAAASVEEIAQFYMGQGQKAGLELKQDDTPSEQTRSISFAKSLEPGKDIGFQANISADLLTEGSVIVALTYVGPG